MIAVGGVATNIYIPTLPAVTADFQTTPANVQLTLLTYFAGVALAQLIYGPLADRYGRRPVLFVGLAIFVIASAACAFAPTIEGLIIARFVQAYGACVGQVIGRAVVRDLFDRNETARAMASITLAIAIAPAAAPVLGAYVHLWAGWRMTFVVVAIFGLIVALIAFRALPETLPRRRSSAGGPVAPTPASGVAMMAAAYWRLLRSRAFMGYSLTSTFIFAALFAFVSDAPFIVITMLGESPQAYSFYSLITVLGFAIGSYGAGRLTPRLGIDRTIILGLWILAAAALVMFGWAHWGRCR
jgi:DHA1 family bicyclomycin/chloramphenicol resistance-like MFS transporter